MIDKKYIHRNFSRLQLSDEGYHSTMQIRGGESGRTSWLNVNNDTVNAIEEVICNIEEFKRMKILLKATKEILTKCDDSGIVEDVLSITTTWDNVECDGFCLLDELNELTLI